ncbi:MAG: tetratricopeptide repeat protein, partial [Pirellulales bacterium]
VQQNPETLEARLVAGNYYRGQRTFEKASEHAAKTLELDPTSRSALWLSAQIALGEDKLDEARRFAEQGVEEHPQYAPLYTVMSDINIRERQRDEAMQWLRRGIEATDRHPQLVWHLGRFLIDTGQLERAEELLDELHETNYAPGRIMYLDARLSLARQQWRKAAEQFSEARSEIAAWPSLVKRADYSRGLCYQRMNQTERAESAFRAALGMDRFFAPARAALARLLQQTGQLDEAKAEWASVARLSGRGGEAAASIAEIQLQQILRQPAEQRNWQAFESMLERLEQAGADPLTVVKLRVAMLLARNRLDEARQLIQQAREEQPEEPDLWFLPATLAMRDGDWQRAAEALDAARQKFGDSVRLRLTRARLWAAQHGADAAERLPALAENTDEFSESQTAALQSGLMEVAERIGAEDLFDRWMQQALRSRPDHLALRLKLFYRAIQQGDRDAMRDELAAIKRIEGEGPHWLYGRAVLLSVEAEGDDGQAPDAAKLNTALNLLEQAREARPRWSRIPLLMAGIHERLGQDEKALEDYRSAVDLGQGSPRLFQRLIAMLNQRQLYAEAQERLEQMARRQVQGSQAIERLKMQTLLGAGDMDRALQQARKTAEDSPRPQDHMWLGRLLTTVAARHQRAEEPEKAVPLLKEAERATQRAVELEPTAAEPYLALIQFYLATDRRGDAMGVVDRIKSQVPEEQRLLVLGRAYEMLGEEQLAEQAYERAVEISPQQPAPVRVLADYYWRRGKREDAEKLARRLMNKGSLESS